VKQVLPPSLFRVLGDPLTGTSLKMQTFDFPVAWTWERVR
jgi:hypothetical protein